MGLGRGPLLRAMSSLPTSSAVNAKASAAPASSVGRAETAGTVIPARAARRCNCAATDSAGWPNETPSSADGTDIPSTDLRKPQQQIYDSDSTERTTSAHQANNSASRSGSPPKPPLEAPDFGTGTSMVRTAGLSSVLGYSR